MSIKKSTEEQHEIWPFKCLRGAVSVFAILVAVAHIVWPMIAIDAITLGLIVVAILPWLAPLVKSVELPGGMKIELQDLEKSSSRADLAGLLAPKSTMPEEDFSFQSIVAVDPNLALAGLRIEIEKRLLRLAKARGLQTPRASGIGSLLRALRKADVLTHEDEAILLDLTYMLNSAVHGATVDARAANWAIDVGPRLLTSLDERVDQASN